MRQAFVFFLPLLGLFAKVQIDLNHPFYKEGVLCTEGGGVIHGEDLRIQAEKICYFHSRDGNTEIEAEGDLLIQYKNKAYVGEKLFFDLEKKEGMVLFGKTAASMFFIGGDKIQLFSNGNYRAENAFITSCENKDSSWDLHARKVCVQKNELFSAKKVRFRLFKIPTLWLPSFRLNLKRFKEPIFRYYINWNKGPKAGVRYQLYSWIDWAAFARVEYRYGKGWGGAIESAYKPKDSPTSFLARGYLGKDRLFNAEDVERRYRLQGALFTESASEKTRFHLTWDKYSDVRMPQDFKTDDFEVDTALKTKVELHHTGEDFLTYGKALVRANSFETLKQELPTLFLATKPLCFKKVPVFFTQNLKASYLDFSYSDQLTSSLNDFSAFRIEGYERLFFPLPLKALTLTPFLEARACFYSDSPSSKEKLLGQVGYGADLEMSAWKDYRNKRHVLKPYLSYRSLSHPSVSPDAHYIFSLQDGLDKIDQLKVGFRNLVFFPKGKEQRFEADLFFRAFFEDASILKLIPKGYLFFYWKTPYLHFSSENCYNFRNHVPDFSNTRLSWTIGENAALSIEGRYRSRYDWRKSDHENFILDVTRKEDELLFSPLSDRRITILTRAFFRLNPFWELKFESHHGFYRLYKNEHVGKSYNEFKIHLYTWLSSSWKLHFYYGYTLNNHFDWNIGLQLVKKSF